MAAVRVAILGQGRSGRDIHGAHLAGNGDRYRIVAVVDPLRERPRAHHAAEVRREVTGPSPWRSGRSVRPRPS